MPFLPPTQSLQIHLSGLSTSTSTEGGLTVYKSTHQPSHLLSLHDRCTTCEVSCSAFCFMRFASFCCVSASSDSRSFTRPTTLCFSTLHYINTIYSGLRVNIEHPLYKYIQSVCATRAACTYCHICQSALTLQCLAKGFVWH